VNFPHLKIGLSLRLRFTGGPPWHNLQKVPVARIGANLRPAVFRKP
jgi:hypothetical protein